MDIKEIETLKAEIERFKTEFRGTFVYDNLLLTLTDDQIFDYLSIKNNRVMFNKHPAGTSESLRFSHYSSLLPIFSFLIN